MHYFYKRLYFLNYVIIYEKAKDLSSEIIGEDDLDSILYSEPQKYGINSLKLKQNFFQKNL
jgi:hypothetical protein